MKPAAEDAIRYRDRHDIFIGRRKQALMTAEAFEGRDSCLRNVNLTLELNILLELN